MAHSNKVQLVVAALVLIAAFALPSKALSWVEVEECEEIQRGDLREICLVVLSRQHSRLHPNGNQMSFIGSQRDPRSPSRSSRADPVSKGKAEALNRLLLDGVGGNGDDLFPFSDLNRGAGFASSRLVDEVGSRWQPMRGKRRFRNKFYN